MKTYIVQLDNHDDVISARDKISWSKAGRVLLVWPRRGRVLERQIDLLLLKRHAQHSGAQLAIVTGNGLVKTNASELGIPVFSRVDDAQQVTWRRERRRRRIPRRRAPRVDPQDLRMQREALTAPERLPAKIRLAAFVAGLLSVIALVFVFLPEAQIELHPTRIPQRLVIPMWASPSLPSASSSGGIPAIEMAVVVEGRDEAPATGQGTVADAPASGEVQLTNLTDQPVVVPEGSIVMTTAGSVVRFSTVREVRIPSGPGQQAVARIEAVEPGAEGNVSAGRIRAMEGMLGLRLVVENLQATRGGTDRRGPAPNEQDYQRLREQLLSTLQNTASVEMTGNLQPGQLLLAETLRVKEVVEETIEPEVNQPGDRLLVSMRVQFTALVVVERDMQQVAQAALDANREGAFRAVPGSLDLAFASAPQIDSSVSENSARPATARWNLRVERLLENILPDDAIAQIVQGQDVSEASSRLQARIALEEPPKIQIRPSWWPRMPFLPYRIQVVKP